MKKNVGEIPLDQIMRGENISDYHSFDLEYYKLILILQYC